MDLEAVLRRRPEVALVDELAHTNVPGAGLGARWLERQDDDPARAIAEFARPHHITQIVIVSSQRGRLRHWPAAARTSHE
jgi:K+-sensing histidine kinase KdpD